MVAVCCVTYGERHTHPTVLMRLGVHPKVAQERSQASPMRRSCRSV